MDFLLDLRMRGDEPGEDPGFRSGGKATDPSRGPGPNFGKLTLPARVRA